MENTLLVSLDVPRGSARGGGRGAAPRGVGRGQPFTNVSRGTHPTADEPSIATTTPTSWSLAVTASHNEASNSSGPSASLATIGNELGQSVDLEPTNQSIGALPSEEAKPESNHPPRDGNLNGLVEPPKFTSELAKKPISRVIAPGTKMSWAQIARFRYFPERFFFFFRIFLTAHMSPQAGRTTQASRRTSCSSTTIDLYLIWDRWKFRCRKGSSSTRGFGSSDRYRLPTTRWPSPDNHPGLHCGCVAH
jgi:hypothetical protein